MNIRESLNRGFNLLAISIVGLSGFAFLPEAIFEKDIPDKIDDLLLFVLGVVSIVWYKRSNNRFMRSVMPVVYVALALIVKIAAIVVKFNDAESVGDDFGALILFLLALGLVWYQYKKTRKLLEAAN